MNHSIDVQFKASIPFQDIGLVANSDRQPKPEPRAEGNAVVVCTIDRRLRPLWEEVDVGRGARVCCRQCCLTRLILGGTPAIGSRLSTGREYASGEVHLLTFRSVYEAT
jgi:hypothetical protein